ncbi:MAG: Bcr/CflA family drug resistance efflux transporter, partial [Alphaproteobacteria bacterium]|nr:Bcr/CflA family drug resistance efflux transporter [Alphaproteobacteria bacterium]
IVAALMGFMFALNLIAANTIVIATADKSEIAGTVIALIGAGHFALGTFSGLAVGQLYDGTPLPLALTVAACGLLSFSARRWLVRAAD